MGIYTPNLHMYLADRTEFVDVHTQWNANLDIVDKSFYTVKPKVNTTSFNSPQVNGEQAGNKAWTSYNQDLRYWNGSAWVATEVGYTPWTAMFSLLPDWNPVASDPGMFRITPTDFADNFNQHPGDNFSGARVEFKGQIQYKNLGKIFQGNYDIFNLAQMPLSQFPKFFMPTYMGTRLNVVNGEYNPGMWSYGSSGTNVSLQVFNDTGNDGNSNNVIYMAGFSYQSVTL